VPQPHPNAEQVALCASAAVVTLVFYYLVRGKHNQRRRNNLARELNKARQRVNELEERLVRVEADESATHAGPPVRIWMDGVFDMMHYGHVNAFRQGRALGTYLVVGVNSDETITQCKGAPIQSDGERVATVKACKFVDEVVTGVPYIMNDEYLRMVIEKYQIDYVVHGDDPCIVDGKDVYESARKMGKYRTIPRTEGVSTTDLVGRMLLMTKAHHSASFESQGEAGELASGGRFERRSNFLTTSHMIRLFSAGVRAPPRGARIVYTSGSWDMLHTAHVEALRRAREHGDYLVVGVHNDNVVNEQLGGNFPIMNLHERVLSCLGCKHVDDVLINAPESITAEMIASLKISVVVRLVGTDDEASGGAAGGVQEFRVPERQGILRVERIQGGLTAADVVERISAQQERFQKRFHKKRRAEREYYSQRYGLDGSGEHHEDDEREGVAGEGDPGPEDASPPAPRL